MKKLILVLMIIAGYAIANETATNSIIPAPQNKPENQTYTPLGSQDDFYEYANSEWLKTATIPEDKSSWGSFDQLRKDTMDNLHGIIENIPGNSSNDENSKKIYALYSSFMDEARLEQLGVSPLNTQINKIDNTKRKQLPKLIAHLNQIGVNVPMFINIAQDTKDSSLVIVNINQNGMSSQDRNGLGLPDRDYYLKDDDATLKQIKQKYLLHISNMLNMAGDKNANNDARDIVELETKLATAQWTVVQNRDPVATYNKFTLKKLKKLMPNFDWDSYLDAAQLSSKLKGRNSYLVISQPSYFKELDKILQETRLSTWKAYFKWHLLSDYSPLLSKPYSDAHFTFYSTDLNGIPQQEPRYERGIAQVETAMGEAMGKLYVEKYFPPENKAKVKELVDNLKLAFEKNIELLDWMSPATKERAQKKLAKMGLKIAYPDKWRDYTKLEIKPDDLVGNVMRANQFEYNRQINKLGKPVDQTEWLMTPQLVNAYYDPSKNEIVFPAAILQPPFFDIKADDAFNYGGIGGVIGHEISHAFDDQGSQYDENGNLNNWWTDEDLNQFRAKTSALIKQYNAYSPLNGYFINGDLTLGENIADNSGITVANKAYHISLGNNQPLIINGLSGDQRFCLGWAKIWRAKVRDEAMIKMIKTNPHSPYKFRVDGALSNLPVFYDAFGIKPGDKMYTPPENRIIIW